MPAISDFLIKSQETFHQLGWLGVLAYAAGIVLLQVVGTPLSPVAIAAGFIFGFPGGLLAITLGTNLGAALNFFVSRHVARGLVMRWLGHHEKFRLIDAAVGREGGKIVALLRLCPIPFGIANYCYGLTAVRFWPYAIATFFAIIPANCFFIWLGTSVHDMTAIFDPKRPKNPGEIALLVIGLLGAFFALKTITRIAKNAVAKSEEKTPATI